MPFDPYANGYKDGEIAGMERVLYLLEGPAEDFRRWVWMSQALSDEIFRVLDHNFQSPELQEYFDFLNETCRSYMMGFTLSYAFALDWGYDYMRARQAELKQAIGVPCTYSKELTNVDVHGW